MTVKRIAASVALVAFLGVYQVRTRADEPGRHGDQSFNAGQVKEVVDREKESLPKMIEKAEKKTGGKAAFACVKEWRNIREEAMRGSFNADIAEKDIREMDPTHPVGTVIVV